jgi:hypothetical protein
VSLSTKEVETFQDAIRKLHGCESTYVESVSVQDPPKGPALWARTVHVFDLQGHPTAARCYTWAENVARIGHRKRFFAVLHQVPVDSPLNAVRAAIVEDYRQHGGNRG